MKIRTIITQDAEVDDRNSLRHFLLCSNEVEIQGIIQTSSKFHWQGVPGAVKPDRSFGDSFEMFEATGPYDAPYRWPGTDWMFEVIDDYEKDYPKLSRHAEGYPTPDYLRSITKVGNIGYEGEVEAPTEGSELIRKTVLDGDDRTLYIQVWGGCNTIQRALMDIEAEFGAKPDWADFREKLMKKVVLTACGEQDGCYRDYIAEKWPRIRFIKTTQMMSAGYPWLVMHECDSKDCLKAEFMKSEILCGKSALASGYCTWMDGNVYPGEEPRDQFGANPNIANEWFGGRMGLPTPHRYDFLSEGDSPNFYILFPWGFRSLENPAYGGIAGRYARVEEFNSKGEELDYWEVVKDRCADRDGNELQVESMWPYVADIMQDFACRVDWCSKSDPAEAEHAPSISTEGGLDCTAEPGETVCIRAKTDPGAELSYSIYTDASSIAALGSKIEEKDGAAYITVSENAKSGERICVIAAAASTGHYRLRRFAQIIIKVK